MFLVIILHILGDDPPNFAEIGKINRKHAWRNKKNVGRKNAIVSPFFLFSKREEVKINKKTKWWNSVQPWAATNRNTQIAVLFGIVPMGLSDFSFPTIPTAASKQSQIRRYHLPNTTDSSYGTEEESLTWKGGYISTTQYTYSGEWPWQVRPVNNVCYVLRCCINTDRIDNQKHLKVNW